MNVLRLGHSCHITASLETLHAFTLREQQYPLLSPGDAAQIDKSTLSIADIYAIADTT